MDGTDPLSNYRAIREELERFDEELGKRPEVVVVTKADLPAATDTQKELADTLDKDVHLISAVTGTGLNQLLGAVTGLLNPPKAW